MGFARWGRFVKIGKRGGIEGVGCFEGVGECGW
jgi:hypothetical protein